MSEWKPRAQKTVRSITLLRALLVALAASSAFAQSTSTELRAILERLENLERENRQLKEEVSRLRDKIEPPGAAVISAAPAPPASSEGLPESPAPSLEERVDLLENRTSELAQTRIESASKSPVRLTGMVLFNAFRNSRNNGGADNPPIASIDKGDALGGGTFRQSIIGLTYSGPAVFMGGRVGGSLYMDFFSGSNSPLGHNFRIRTADISLDWDRRKLSFTQDKPLMSPYEPDSLAQVGISPLTGAGNPWIWVPQIRYEERIPIGESTGLRAQAALMQTNETSSDVPAAFASTLERVRPGFESRIEVNHRFRNSGLISAGGAIHTSSTHVAGTSVPSRSYSVDWLVRPLPALELKGLFFSGQNIAHFGTGRIRQGFTVLRFGDVIPVHTSGGWGQLTYTATSRLSFHFMGGIHDDRNRDLTADGIGSNKAYGANFFYRLAPNVIVSLEAMQVRTRYLRQGLRLNNHYDLGVAYVF